MQEQNYAQRWLQESRQVTRFLQAQVGGGHPIQHVTKVQVGDFQAFGIAAPPPRCDSDALEQPPAGAPRKGVPRDAPPRLPQLLSHDTSHTWGLEGRPSPVWEKAAHCLGDPAALCMPLPVAMVTCTPL